MRITFILPNVSMAGGIRVVAIYAERLQRRGHEVSAVSAGLVRPSVRERIRSWAKRADLPMKSRRLPSYFDNLDISHRILDRWRPIVDADVPDADVVVATWWETAEWVANLAPSKGSKAYFMQDYGAPGQELTQVVPTWRLPLHKITISRWLVNLIQENVGNVQVELVPNAVDQGVFYASPRSRHRTPTVGFAYRTEYSKGADLVFQAVNQARETLQSLRLIAYSTQSPPRESLRGLKFYSCPPDRKLREIYASCDAWLFPSRREGFGLPILEAMACRTPVIATRAGAAPELLQRGGGILIPEANGNDMARAILRVFKMSEIEWGKMSDAAHASATSYTWEDATDRFESALREAKRYSSQR